MKFDQSLRYNTVPEWISHYIDYSALKRLIYSLEKLSIDRMQTSNDTERTALIHGNPSSDFDPAATFRRRIDAEIRRVDSFYSQTEEHTFNLVDKLDEDFTSYKAEAAVYEATVATGLNNDLESGLASPINTPKRNSISGLPSSVASYSIHNSAHKLAAAKNADEHDNSSDSDDDHGHGRRSFSQNIGRTNSFRARDISGRRMSLSSTGQPGSYGANGESPRNQSPERLYRHSRTHSADPSEIVAGTSSANTKRRSHSVSAVRHLHYGAYNSALDTQRELDDVAAALRLRTINIYVSLSELRSFLQLNRTGFTKALKKFDKTLNTSLKEKYLADILPKTYVFGPATESHLIERIEQVVNIFAELVTRGDHSAAVEQLHAYLRESVVFDRNTVWRDQMELSRLAHYTPPVKNVVLQGQDGSDEKAPFVRIFGYNVPSYLVNPDAIKITVIALIFFAILSFPLLESDAQNRCLAVVISASLLWALEAMPLFVTSLLIPFLIVCLRIPCNSDGEQMTAPQASAFIFSCMWSPVIQLLLGGFTLASALSKYNIAKMLATKILASAGTNPKMVLLTLMFVATFLSMWISNVAAPVLCYSIAQSVLRTLPNGSPFGKAIVLGIALASNIGGMASPIASPQNVIALENMDPAPTWLQWFAVSIPISILSILGIWVLLVLTFKPGKDVRIVAPIRMVNERFGPTQWFISIVTILTIFLWCISHQLEPYVGDMGVLALIPIVAFFGTKVLSSEDFNNFLWTIIALAMGGTALGKAVSSSGLLATVAHGIEEHIIRGMGVFGVMVVFGFMILILATFVSHTVAALIILPLIKSVGERMDDPHPRLLVMGAAFLCSAAMGLPTSGFPNVTAICMTDEFNRPYLTVGNFISRGVPSSFLAYALIVTVGYIILRTMGF